MCKPHHGFPNACLPIRLLMEQQLDEARNNQNTYEATHLADAAVLLVVFRYACPP